MDAHPQHGSTRHAGVGGAFDVSATPSGLITVRWLRVATEDESLALMRWLSTFWEGERPYAVVMVTSPSVQPDARDRRRWAEWHEANREALRRHCRGVAIAGQSASVRALMTMMSWFSKNSYPTNFVATEREARAWAASRLLDA